MAARIFYMLFESNLATHLGERNREFYPPAFYKPIFPHENGKGQFFLAPQKSLRHLQKLSSSC